MIDREIAPIWHDRFARLIVRNLPGASDVIALDIHCGVGRTTAELLARLGPAARVLALIVRRGIKELDLHLGRRKGHAIQFGTPAQLAEQQGLYARLKRLQSLEREILGQTAG